MEVLNEILSKIEHLEKSFQVQNSKWLTVLESAEYCRISESKMRKLLGSGKISIHRIGGKILLHRKELDYLILTGSARPSKRDRERVECLL